MNTMDLFAFALKHFQPKPLYFKSIAAYKDLTEEEKNGLPFIKHCLSMYLTAPECYSFSKKHYNLVDKSKFWKVTNDLNFDPGFDDKVFELFKIKVQSFERLDKFCILTFDENPLKPNLFYNTTKDEIIGFENNGTKKTFKAATRVFVIMANGLHTQWKQPLAYFFAHESFEICDLVNYLAKCIIKTKRIGLDVVAVVSNVTPATISLSKALEVTPEKPFFLVNGQKVLYFFDVPHLMVKSRNKLMKYRVEYNNEKPDWKYIVDAYEESKSRKYSIHKLTEAHINPSPKQRKDCTIAIETLQHMVAAEISLKYGFAKNESDKDPRRMDTAHYIKRFDILYNTFNSPEQAKTDPEYCKPFKSSPRQNQTLKDSLKFLQNAKVFRGDKDITEQIDTFKCWQINIQSLLLLWNVLKTKGYPKIETRRLNLKDLGSFFDVLKGMKLGVTFLLSGKQQKLKKKLTPIQFYRGFRKQFTKNLIHTYSKSTGLQYKMHQNLMLKAKKGQFAVAAKPSSEVNLSTKTILLKDCDYHKHDLDNVTYLTIRKYLLKKCLSVHSCDTCEHFLENQKAFIEYICNLDKEFETKFDKFSLNFNMLKNFTTSCTWFEKHQCPNFPKQYLINMFCRMRLFYALKTVNGNFKTSNDNSIIHSMGILSVF